MSPSSPVLKTALDLNSPSSRCPAAQENFIAYVQTFEPVPNTDQRKPRFLIVSSESVSLALHSSRRPSLSPLVSRTPALRDGKLKLHKAKQNANGTFSIGKTWSLEDLRQVEVSKVRPLLPLGRELAPHLTLSLTCPANAPRPSTRARHLPSSHLWEGANVRIGVTS